MIAKLRSVWMDGAESRNYRSHGLELRLFILRNPEYFGSEPLPFVSGPTIMCTYVVGSVDKGTSGAVRGDSRQIEAAKASSQS